MQKITKDEILRLNKWKITFGNCGGKQFLSKSVKSSYDKNTCWSQHLTLKLSWLFLWFIMCVAYYLTKLTASITKSQLIDIIKTAFAWCMSQLLVPDTSVKFQSYLDDSWRGLHRLAPMHRCNLYITSEVFN